MKKEIESVFFSFELNKANMPKKPIYQGNLTIDKVNGMKLVFCINNIPLDDKFNNKNLCMYGQTVNGKKFTIDNSFMASNRCQSLVSEGFLLSCHTISINRIFMGDWISDVSNLKIDNFSVRFSYFEHWFKWMEVKNVNNREKNTDDFVMPVKQFKSDFNATINKKLNIGLSYSWQEKTEGNRIFEFNSKRFLKLNFPQTTEIESALNKVFILKSLFQVLLAKEKVFTEDLQFYRNEQKIIVYKTQSNYVSEKDNVSQDDFLDKFHEKESEKLFIKWFGLYEKYGSIFDMIIANINQSKGYIENSFLAKIQWIEGFCRIKYPTTEIQKNKHKGKLVEIQKKLKDDDLEYFSKITGYPHETSLISQLKRTIEDCNILNIVGGDKDKLNKFIKAVIRNRNNLTHGKNKKHHTVKLFYQNIFLQCLIYIILIRELELSNRPVYDTHTKNIKSNYNKYYTEDG